MRVGKADSGHTLKYRLMFGAAHLFGGSRIPDVVRALTYRKELWGQPFSEVLHEAMTRDGFFTRRERELFAAYTSKLNDCTF